MVEWDLTAGAETTEFLRFKGRTKLNTKTGDVTIIRLAKEDSGLYEGEFQIAGVLRLTPCELKVLDPVTEANVNCETSDDSTTLHCTAVGDSLTYSWSGPGLPTAGMSGQTGPQISHENQDSVYTCNVSNPVGHVSVSFHARDCFGTRDSKTRVAVIGLAATAAVLVLLLALAVGIWCYLKKRNQEGNVCTGIETGPSGEKQDAKRPLLESPPRACPIPLPGGTNAGQFTQKCGNIELWNIQA
ncbi:signaling lymphocytic activation molecule-like [Engraulis encrasicolus]|uniref:signaling lymphocytic activation molecule-like n=1 Tax=Engraulis encrasicolus TaxID=184585 RepID=UPI002FCEACBE